MVAEMGEEKARNIINPEGYRNKDEKFNGYIRAVNQFID